MHVEDFILQVFEVVVVEVKSSFESTIGYSSLMFQEVDNLDENVIKGHDRHSAVCTAALLRRNMPQNREEGKGTNSVYYKRCLEPMPLAACLWGTTREWE